MAEVVQKFAVPIGEVLSSPLYRCRETADAFGAAAITMVLRTFPTTAETAALVAARPRAGTNRVLATHHFVIENHVPGIAVGDIGESEAAVVRTAADGSVQLVGRITLEDWKVLAGAAAETAGAETGSAEITPEAASSAPVVLPATPVAHLAAGYVEAFNSGNPEGMRRFIEESLVPVAERPTEVRLQGYAQLFEQHGPLTIVGVGSSAPDALELRVRSRVGDGTLRVAAAPQAHGRAQSITFTFGSPGHP
jgi:hypothetical protein